MTSTRQFLLVLLPLFILFGCKSGRPYENGEEREQVAAHNRAQKYMERYFSGDTFTIRCPTEQNVIFHNDMFFVCTVTTSAPPHRLMTLLCNVDLPPTHACFLQASAQ